MITSTARMGLENICGNGDADKISGTWIGCEKAREQSGDRNNSWDEEGMGRIFYQFVCLSVANTTRQQCIHMPDIPEHCLDETRTFQTVLSQNCLSFQHQSRTLRLSVWYC